MLDKTSKTVIAALKSRPDATYSYLDDYPQEFPTKEEFFSTVRYLVKKDLAEIIHDQRGSHIGVRLTHEAIHYNEFWKLNILRYVLDNWISFISLLVALTALVISVIHTDS